MWWEIDIPQLFLVDSLITWANETSLSAINKKIFHAVIIGILWSMWHYRNKLILERKNQEKMSFLMR